MKLPAAFDPAVYRALHADLSALSDAELVNHYNLYGKTEGRIGKALADRNAFAALIGPELSALEIGPFHAPMLKGPNARFCDVLDQAELKQRAIEEGLPTERVPTIHFKVGSGFLDEIRVQFDAIFSSHSIEHQPDLIRHLQQIERRLTDTGRYFAIIPDQRYCFDREFSPSTIADVLQAHHEGRTRHSLQSVIEHRALRVHNDPVTHWKLRDRQPLHQPEAPRISAAVQEFVASAGAYIDVHAWFFTPDSFYELLTLLRQLKKTNLQIERLYRTRLNANEFWVVLKKGEVIVPASDLATAERERPFSLLETERLSNALVAEQAKRSS